MLIRFDYIVLENRLENSISPNTHKFKGKKHLNLWIFRSCEYSCSTTGSTSSNINQIHLSRNKIAWPHYLQYY